MSDEFLPPLGDLEPAEADENWERRVRAAHEAPPAGHLAEADALCSVGTPGARVRALAFLRAFHDTFDPATATDRARLMWVLENDHRRDAVVLAITDRLLAVPVDDGSHDRARLVRSQALADAGRIAEAENSLKALLADHRGTGDRMERLACVSLAKLFAHRRRGFEALVMGHRAADLARKAGDEWDLALARSRICMALAIVDDIDRLRRALDELEQSLNRLPNERTPPLRYILHWQRAVVAVDAEDVEGLRAALAGLRGTGSPGHFPGDPRLLPYVESWIALLEGDANRALELVQQAQAMPALLPTSDLVLLLLEARCRRARDGAVAALDPARKLLERLLPRDAEEDSPDPFGDGTRIRFVSFAGRLLDDAGAPEAEVRAAFDRAATAVLRRIASMEQLLDSLPELNGVHPAVVRAMLDYRVRFLADQQQLLEAVAARVRTDALARCLVDPEALEPGMLFACAWCRRVRAASGRWLPVGEYLPDDPSLRVSHGICRDCHARWSPLQ